MTFNDQNSFLSKSELLRWLCNDLCINIKNIEELSTGAVYCIILNLVHPGSIPSHKINLKAKQEYEFICNFKLLQQAFLRLSIEKIMNIERLVKGFDHINMLQ